MRVLHSTDYETKHSGTVEQTTESWMGEANNVDGGTEKGFEYGGQKYRYKLQEYERRTYNSKYDYVATSRMARND